MGDVLQVSSIRTDGGTQARIQLDWIAVDEYSKAMQDGATFPPLVVFHDGADYWLADGFHRLDAAERAEIETVNCDVRMGTKRDAILYAVGANADHGVRRTNADKRAAVTRLLEDEEWRMWSDREIARRCNVDHKFVSKQRKSYTGDIPSEKLKKRTYTTKHGTVATMNTANIGSRNGNGTAPDTLPEWVTAEDGESQLDEEVVNEIERLPVEVIQGDSSRFFAQYTIEPVDLIVTSPPYNVGIDYGLGGDDLSTYFDLIQDVWSQCHESMVDGGRICVVVPFGIGRNPWVPLASMVMSTLEDAGFTLRGQIVWDKNTTGNRTTWGSFRMPTNPSLRDTTECIIVAHKGDGALVLPDGLKLSDEKGTHSEWLASSDYFMELAQDHWVISPESAKRVGHPAPFPVEIARRLSHFYGYQGMHIADPFCGSGTVGVAARELNCRATLMDVSADYCELAKGRIDDCE